MQLTTPSLNLFFQNANLAMQAAYNQAPDPFWSQFATRMPSATEQEIFGWSTRTGLLREWVGERQARSVGSASLTVLNRHYESTLELSADKIRDDQFGLFNFALQDLARAAKIFPDVLSVFNVFVNGDTLPGYDGSTFFSTSHPLDVQTGQVVTSVTQSNRFASTPLTFDNYQNVRQQMMKFRGEDGLPLGVMPNLIIVGPELEVTARLICEAGQVAPQVLGGNTQVGVNQNVLQGTCQVLVWPLLGIYAPNNWFLLDTSRSVKPIIYQDRQSPQTIQGTDPSFDNVFKRNMFVYGVDMRLNVFGGLWWLMAKCSP